MNIENALYVLSSVLFIFGIKRLSHPKTARSGNSIASMGMLIAIVTTLLANSNISSILILLFAKSVVTIAISIPMEAMKFPLLAVFG